MAALCLFLVPVCLFDYVRYKIPNLFLLVIAFTGMAENFIAGGMVQSLLFPVKSAIVIAVMYPFFKIGTIGAGDVKLLGLCAGFFSSDRILYFLFFSMLTAAVFSTVKMLKEQNFKERFSYFGSYICDILRTGNWKLYMEDRKAGRKAGLCLSGPILISVIMHWGGLY